MANHKKSRLKKKKPVTFSIQTGHLERFQELCKEGNLIPSNEVERLIVEHNHKTLEI